MVAKFLLMVSRPGIIKDLDFLISARNTGLMKLLLY